MSELPLIFKLNFAIELKQKAMIDSNGVSETKKTTKSNVNVLNYMTPAFFKRLNSIIDMSFYKQCGSVESEFEEEDKPLAATDKFTIIELYVEPEHEIRKAIIESDNWMVNYKLKPELERVVWRSKLYSKEKVVTKSQSLVERTENQVDIALKKFCNWFQSVFEDKHSHVTEDYIKKLFSSGFEIHPAAHSIYIEPKQVFSIPHQVAEKYHVPELSTKNQQKKQMNLDETDASSIVPSPANIAFGKCLPTHLKQPRRVIDDCMKPNFPDELRTDEYLFKGIEDLRSTKILVKHVNQSDRSEMKPLYFKNFIYEDDEKYVPLYKKLENKM